MSRRTIAGIVAFGLAAVCLAVTLLTFPWHEGDAVSAAYVVAIAVGGSALVWGIALVVAWWRLFAVAFAAVSTVFASVLAWLIVSHLPSCAAGLSRPPITRQPGRHELAPFSPRPAAPSQ